MMRALDAAMASITRDRPSTVTGPASSIEGRTAGDELEGEEMEEEEEEPERRLSAVAYSSSGAV
jgi:hypothetical protein